MAAHNLHRRGLSKALWIQELILGKCSIQRSNIQISLRSTNRTTPSRRCRPLAVSLQVVHLLGSSSLAQPCWSEEAPKAESARAEAQVYPSCSLNCKLQQTCQGVMKHQLSAQAEVKSEPVRSRGYNSDIIKNSWNIIYNSTLYTEYNQ